MTDVAQHKSIVAVDFDGTIHSYEKGWQDGRIYGTALPGFFAWAATATKDFDLVVISSRSNERGGIDEMRQWMVKQWDAHCATLDMTGVDLSESADILVLGVVVRDSTVPRIELRFSATKPPAIVTIDDRCICFRGDWWDLSLTPRALYRFKPWNSK